MPDESTPLPAPRNAGHAFAVVVVDELARHGVTDAVVAPGSRSTPVALALAGDSRIRVHVRIDERSASYLALGLAKTCGRPVPVLCTSGTATAHLHGAVMEADQSRVPLLVLTADRPPELRGVGANQTVDQAGLYGSAPRWSCDVGVPEARADSVRYWRSLVSRAVAVALGRSGGPAGPVHLDLPLREPLTPVDDGVGFPWPVDGRPDGAPWTDAHRGPVPLAAGVADRIARARHGVVVAGDGLTDDDARAVAELAERAGWPLVAEPHSNARRGPNALRAVEPMLGAASFADAHRPDLVVVAGRVGLSRALLGWLSTVPHVVVDRDGAWTDPSRTALAVVRADPSAVRDCPVVPAAPEWLASWTDASARVATALDRLLDADDAPSEPRTARDVAALVPAGGALVVASSMPIRDLDLLMRSRADLRVLANRGVSGIDGFVSTAMGVALSHDGPTVALAGDLSLVHDVNGLVAADRADLTLVVLNNDGGGIFSLLPQSTGGDEATFERLFGTPHGIDVARLAAAYGAAHASVDSADALAAAVAKHGDGVRIVEVRTDRRENADLHARMRAAATTALG